MVPGLLAIRKESSDPVPRHNSRQVMISRLIGVWFFGGFPVAKTLSLGIEAAKATNFQFCHSQRGPITADFHRHLRFFHLTAAVILSMVTLRFLPRIRFQWKCRLMHFAVAINLPDKTLLLEVSGARLRPPGVYPTKLSGEAMKPIGRVACSIYLVGLTWHVPVRRSFGKGEFIT